LYCEFLLQEDSIHSLNFEQEGLCCRVFNPDDAPGVTEYPAGPYGNPNCDSPLILEENLYSAIERIVPDASFTLLTGDLVERIQWLTTDKDIVMDIDSCYSHMKGLELVYGAVGNHEANPVSSFPPAGVQTLANQSNQYMYDTLAENWIDWIRARRGSKYSIELRSIFGTSSMD
jgi:sphingomyelin phosphodiesterase